MYILSSCSLVFSLLVYTQFNFQEAKHHLAVHINAFLETLKKILVFLQQVQGCPADSLSVASMIQDSLQMMVGATEQEQMTVVFLGSTSSGKSTIINALVKQDVLPVGKGTTSSCFCTITDIPPGQDDGYVKKTGSQEKKKLTVRHGQCTLAHYH